MNLPILGTLSALFTKANEKLQELLQPWALFSAAIFLGLGLFLIYLPLQPTSEALKAWEKWSTTWQVIVASTVLFSLAYLINSLSGLFLVLAGGRWLRRSPIIGRLLVHRQWEDYKRLEKATIEGNAEQRSRAFYRLAYEFPTPARPSAAALAEAGLAPSRADHPRDLVVTAALNSSQLGTRDAAAVRLGLGISSQAEAAHEFATVDATMLAPTRLGNVRAAVSTYSMNQYGAHLDTIWPALNQTLGDKDESLRTQIEGEQTTTTFLATVTVLLVVVAALAAPVGLLVANTRWFVTPFVLLGLAYVIYRAAVARAQAWARLIRAALDLHLDETGERLGLESLAGDPEAARGRWQAVSRWLAYGGLGLDPQEYDIPLPLAEWYKKPASPSPTTVSASPGVTVTPRVVARRLSGVTGDATDDGPLGLAYDVTLTAAWSGPVLVSANLPSSPQPGGFVTISDTRLPRLLNNVSGVIHYPDGSMVQAVTPVVSRDDAEGDALLWRLPDLAQHGSLVLTYTITPIWLDLGPDVILELIAPAASDPANRLVMRLHYTGQTVGPVSLGALPVGPDSASTSFSWRPVVASGGAALNRYTGQPDYDPQERRATWLINGVTPDSRLTLVVTLVAHGLSE